MTLAWSDAVDVVNDLNVVDVKDILEASDIVIEHAADIIRNGTQIQMANQELPVEMTFDIEKFRRALCIKISRV